VREISTEQSQNRSSGALEYSNRPGQLSTNYLARAAFGAGLSGMAAVLVSLFVMNDGGGFQRSLFLGGVGGGLVGIFCGMLGIGEAKRTGHGGRIESRNGFILGCVALLMVPVSASLGPTCCYPVARVNRVKCQSNLRSVGQGLLLYANDHGGQLPPRLGLLIAAADLRPEVFVCPSSGHQQANGVTTEEIAADLATPGRCSYVYMGAGMTSSSITVNHILAYERLDYHEGDGAHFLFGDGHVEWRNATDAKKWIKQLKSGVNPPK